MAGKITYGYIPKDKARGANSPRVSASIAPEDMEALDRIRHDVGATRAEIVRVAIINLIRCVDSNPEGKQKLMEAIGR